MAWYKGRECDKGETQSITVLFLRGENGLLLYLRSGLWKETETETEGANTHIGQDTRSGSLMFVYCLYPIMDNIQKSPPLGIQMRKRCPKSGSDGEFCHSMLLT